MRETAMGFAYERLAPNALRWDKEKHFPLDVLREAASLGFAAINASEDHGGVGLARLDAVVIFEALAMGCPTIAAYLSVHNMCVWMVDRFGSEAQRRDWSPRLATMQVFSSYCLTEPGSGSDAAALRTRAEPRGGDYVLHGEKQFISGAGAGGRDHLYIVMARTGGDGPRGVSAFLVEGESPGLTLGAAERKMGWNAQPTHALSFEGCRVPASNLLGREGEGFKIAMAGLDGGRLNIGACSLGGGQAALDKTLCLYGGKVGLRPSPRRIPGFAIPSRRYGHEIGGRARSALARGGGARRLGQRSCDALRDGEARRHGRRVRGRQ